MTNEERIEHLKQELLNPKRTPVEKVLRVVGWICSAIAVVALIVGIYAVHQALSIASCVNGVLASRNVPAATDDAAHIAFAQAVQGLFLPRGATPAQQRAEVAAFRRAVNSYVVTLLADQRERNAKPLGRC